MLPSFAIGDFYTSEEIYKSLGVGNAGGVRVSVDDHSAVKRMVVLTALPSARTVKENPYHDRIEGDVLVYTGAGKEGDQELSGVNRRFSQQQSDLFPIYGFMLMSSRRDKRQGPKRWQFLGMLEYLRQYQDVQVDARGLLRKIWLFEFRIHREQRTVSVLDDSSAIVRLLNGPSSLGVATDDDRQVSLVEESLQGDSAQFFQEIEQLRSRLLSLDPRRFEHVIRHILQRTSFPDVEVTKYSQDGGIDLNAYPSDQLWPIQGMLIQIQAKRWLHTVGRKEVAELRGSLEPYARGVVVTTSHFSKAAKLEATSPGKNPIVLVDGVQFATIIHSLEAFDLVT